MYTFFYRHLAELNDTTRRRMARALTWFTRTVIFIIYVLALLIVISQRNTPTTQVRQVAQQAVQVEPQERR